MAGLLSTTSNQATTPWSPVTGVSAYPILGADPAEAKVTDAAPVTPASAATRTISNDELTSTNVANVASQDSPLMQQASARALQSANSRGLLNSSMAVGAAEGAVLDRAIQIGGADAAAKSNVLNSNQANQQQTNVFNAGQQQQNNQFNASEANKASIVNSTESNKILSQLLDSQNKLYLADVEARYNTLMQTDASAMTLYQQSIKNISDILQNPDLTPEAKTASVSNQNQLLRTGMQILGKINGLNLDALLNFPSA